MANKVKFGTILEDGARVLVVRENKQRKETFVFAKYEGGDFFSALVNGTSVAKFLYVGKDQREAAESMLEAAR